MAPPVSVFKNLLGTFNTFFQVGLGALGIRLTNNAGALEIRNGTGAALVPLSAADPVTDNQLVTLQYFKKNLTVLPVTAQISGASAAPANTGVAHYIVVTTTGVNASIGQLYFDDGSGAGTAQLFTLSAGEQVVPTANFAGGTVSLNANTIYLWNGAAYAAQPNTIAQTEQVIRFTTALVPVSSGTMIPTGAIITDAKFLVTTPYSAGTTSEIGVAGTPDLLLGTAQNDPTTTGVYDVEQSTTWGAAAVVLWTPIGGPAAGAGVVQITYVPTPLT
jgi:hypothetical protein